MPKVRYLPVSEGWQVNIESFPNFDKSGSILGMKKKYYGKDALLVRLDDGVFTIGEYSIAGNYDDGYTVWRTGEDSDTLYDNISFERCVVWCLNS